MGYKITIDGPAGSGKGYLAQELSTRLGLLNIDTGAMYRAFTLYCKENNINLDNKSAVIKALNEAGIDFKYEGNILKIHLNGKDVSGSIRTEEIGLLASVVSAIPEVRKFMVTLQREIAGTHNIVMEGRDIGSVVFPDADLKIFLTASAKTRAQRRYKDLLLKNKSVTIEEVLESIKIRDQADINKSISPLVKTEDMIEIDTTDLDKKQVVEEVLKLVAKKGWKISD